MATLLLLIHVFLAKNWLESSDMEGAILWIDRYCDEKPLSDTSAAMEELGIPYRVISKTSGHFSVGIEEHYRQAERRPQDEMLNAYQRWGQFVGTRWELKPDDQADSITGNKTLEG